MAVGLLLTLLLVFTGLAGRELNGRTMRWVPVLVLVGAWACSTAGIIFPASSASLSP